MLQKEGKERNFKCALDVFMNKLLIEIHRFYLSHDCIIFFFLLCLNNQTTKKVENKSGATQSYVLNLK